MVWAYGTSITTGAACGSVSSQRFTNTTLAINTDTNLINSTVLTDGPTDLISLISNDGFLETNVESVYIIV